MQQMERLGSGHSSSGEARLRGGGAWDALALAFIVAVTLLYFWRFVGPGVADLAVLPPGDLTEQNYPYRHYASIELFEGRLPIWSPYANGGQPFMADVQTSVLYPPSLLLAYLLMVAGQPDLSFLTYEWYIVLHYVVVALGLYAFVSRTTANRIAGLVSAMAFGFGGYLTTYPPQQTIILQSAAWLPYTLLFLHQVLARGRTRYVPLVAASMAISVLGGHPQTFVYHVYMAGAYGLFLTARAALSSAGETAAGSRGLPGSLLLALRRGRMAWLIAAFALGVALTGGQIGPTTEFWQHSGRATIDYSFTQAGFFPDEYSGLFFPEAGGGKPLYVGLISLLLAILALLRPARGGVLFWAATAVVAGVLAFGGLTPAYDFARQIIPGYGLFRGQERMVYLAVFAVSVLAGHGTARLLTHQLSGMAKRLLLALSPLALVLAGLLICRPAVRETFLDGILASSLTSLHTALVHALLAIPAAALVLWCAAGVQSAGRPRLRRSLLTSGAVAMLLPALVVSDNFVINWTNLAPSPPHVLPRVAVPVAEFLRGRVDNERIDSDTGMPFSAYYYRLPFFRADAPLMVRYFLNAMNGLGLHATTVLFSQRYHVTDRVLQGAELEFQWENLRLYRLPGIPGRVYVAYRIRSIPDDEEALRVVRGDSGRHEFSFGRDVVVADALQSPIEGRGFSRTAGAIDLKPTELVIRADSSAPGLLVLADIYYPGWHAYLDGQEVPIHRANYAVRGVEIPTGVHLIAFRYHPRWLQIGLAISSLGMAALLLLVVRSLPVLPLRRAWWLIPGPWLALVPAFGLATLILDPPAIPDFVRGTAPWEAAYDWAEQRCETIVDPAGPRRVPQRARLTSERAWSSLDRQGTAGLDSACAVVDVAGEATDQDLLFPSGWQIDQAAWFGTLWVARYARQESLVTQIQHRREVSLGGVLAVAGFSWPGAQPRGDLLEIGAAAWPPDLELYLRGELSTATDYRIFVQLLDVDGRAVVVSDHHPQDGARPTSGWTAGEIIVDPHRFAGSSAPTPGRYVLIAGAYDEKTSQRLRTDAGGDFTVLAQIEVRGP